jgi:hypothetical protein
MPSHYNAKSMSDLAVGIYKLDTELVIDNALYGFIVSQRENFDACFCN